MSFIVVGVDRGDDCRAFERQCFAGALCVEFEYATRLAFSADLAAGQGPQRRRGFAGFARRQLQRRNAARPNSLVDLRRRNGTSATILIPEHRGEVIAEACSRYSSWILPEWAR
jgi:hypothetical protein